MNLLILVVYLLFATLGIILMKLGGSSSAVALFTVPVVNLPVSMTMLSGFFCYGCSFLLYTVLINRFQLSYIIPLTTGIMYLFTLVASVVLFKELMTPARGIGALLILTGVFFMNVGR